MYREGSYIKGPLHWIAPTGAAIVGVWVSDLFAYLRLLGLLYIKDQRFAILCSVEVIQKKGYLN